MRTSAALWSIGVASLCAGCFSVRNGAGFTYRKVAPAEYAELLSQTPGAVLIDVRTRAEFTKEHLAGARWNGFLRPGFARRMQEVDRETPVFLYCHSCHRSPLAARRLKKKGFHQVVDLEGGYQRWVRENPGTHP